MIGIHDSDLFWLALIAAFVSGMACGWCLRDIRDAWDGRAIDQAAMLAAMLLLPTRRALSR